MKRGQYEDIKGQVAHNIQNGIKHDKAAYVHKLFFACDDFRVRYQIISLSTPTANSINHPIKQGYGRMTKLLDTEMAEVGSASHCHVPRKLPRHYVAQTARRPARCTPDWASNGYGLAASVSLSKFPWFQVSDVKQN